MKILFEGCRYETRVLKKVINRHFYTPDNGSTYSKVERVGYYYDSEAENPDAVIILPKVFIDKEGLAFGEDPKAILEYNKETRERLRKTNNDAILFNISTWIYQAIKCFRKRHSESKIVNEEQNQNIISNYNESDSTELDIILTLLKFHKDNQQLFTYIAKINNSGRKINWTKTVTKKTPIISGGF